MAKRRWSTGRRLAYGLGTGLSSALSDITRNRMAERSAERVARRQEEGDIRTASRMESAAARAARVKNQQDIAGDLPKVASGEMSVDAYMAKLSALGMDGMFPSEFDVDYAGTGEPQQEAVANAGATRQALQALRPPLRRSLKPIGTQIDAAKELIEVPDIQSIVNQARAADDRASEGGIPTEALIDPNEPESMVASMAPEVRDYVNQAMGRSQALMGKPGTSITIQNPDGSTTVQTPTVADEMRGVLTAPDAITQGTIKGQTEGTADVTKLGISGDAEAEQARKVAGLEAGAREQAQIQAKLSNAQALIDYDVKLAMAKLGVVGAEVDTRKYAEQIAEAREAASKAAPVVAQLQAMWLNAQPALEQWSGITGRTGLQSYESMPASWKNQAINNYDGLVDAVRPLLARAFGQTGNPAIMEQVWAKYVPTYAEALRPEDALRKLARLETLLLSQVQIAMVAKERGTALTIGDIEAIVEPRIEAAYQGLKQQAVAMRRNRNSGQASAPMTPPTDLPSATFIVTPTGIQLAPPPRPQ